LLVLEDRQRFCSDNRREELAMKKICVLAVCLAVSLFTAGCESKAKQDAATKAADDAKAAAEEMRETTRKAAAEVRAAADEAAAAAKGAAADLKAAGEDAAAKARKAAEDAAPK
jgi:outer membrane murein-binding lipoprotein Lpp